ncbi:hypothetical protein [Hymenobacter glacialis]|uniref:Uncharacterized protein n=1 Tax=Hymenobacter glacialis TaxID=1908236 RepID=A0A1G1ST03_9BACT|nr:hypothetical protein [Hymenobacter glacialis]OGX81751.1 hypothetical protein BEN48_05845 [Hymenobacter glacialis]
MASRSNWWSVLLLAVLLCSQVAQAQIEPQKPAQLKAANRQALRDAHRTKSPYKDSHLAVKPARLKRGQSASPQAKGLSKGKPEVDFEPRKVGLAKPAGFLGLRRKATHQPRPTASGKKK